MLLPLVPIALLAACGTPPEFATCEDAECRLEQVQSAWRADPDGTLDQVLALDDDLEKSVLITHLMRAGLAAPEQLCGRLEDGSAARFRCDRLVERPHLDRSQLPDAATGQPERITNPPPRPPEAPAPDRTPTASGPRGGKPPPPARAAAPWQDLPPAPDPCEGAEVRAQCIERAAAEAAGQGDLALAGATCLVGDPTQDQGFDECIFRIAETVAAQRTPQALVTGMGLCAHSTWFGKRCVDHVINIHSTVIPSELQTPEALVADATAVVAALRTSAGDDADLAALYTGAFWAGWTTTLARMRTDLAAQVFPRLPAEAAPHTRMATAWRTVSALSALPSPFLDQGPTLLAPRRLARVRHRPGQPAGAPPSALSMTDAWLVDRDGERRIPASFCLGSRRRAVSEDPVIDGQIVLLEAAAMRSPPPPASFFFELVGGDQDELVRWTAARLGRYLYPDEPVTRVDPSPLVQGRVAWTGPRKKSEEDVP